MLTDLYAPGSSAVHRAHPALKITLLAMFCTGLFIVENWATLGVASITVFAGFVQARLNPLHAFVALRPILWALAALFIVQVWLADLLLASFVIGRFVALIMAATLVTLTTKTSEFVDGLLFVLSSAPRSVPRQKIALAISLSLRFIPLVRTMTAEVREAQRARGLDHNLSALLVPLVVRTLKAADDVSYAIYARSFD